MNVHIAPIYHETLQTQVSDIERFKNYDPERTDFSNPDFSIHNERDWMDTFQKVSSLVLKIVIFPWGLYEITRAFLNRFSMQYIYPIQGIGENAIKQYRNQIHQMAAQNQNHIFRDVIMEKDGNAYRGLIVAHGQQLKNGKWVLAACGNGMALEQAVLTNNMNPYLTAGYNVLYVNGPGIWKEKGIATIERIAEAQELGISFLESAVKAEKIVLSGHSIGAAAIGMAAMEHEFKPEIQYLAIRTMAFDKLSNVVRKITNIILAFFITFFGLEMDNTQSCRYFQKNKIHEVIIDAEQDEVIGDHQLGEAADRALLKYDGFNGTNKTILRLEGSTHNVFSHQVITDKILEWDLQSS